MAAKRVSQQVLRDIGFNVKLKPFIQRKDGSAKGDWDVGITLDLVELAENVDTIALASGDGDFDLAIERVQSRHHVSTEVYGVEALTATSLIKATNRYIPITDELLLDKIKRR